MNGFRMEPAPTKSTSRPSIRSNSELQIEVVVEHVLPLGEEVDQEVHVAGFRFEVVRQCGAEDAEPRDAVLLARRGSPRRRAGPR